MPKINSKDLKLLQNLNKTNNNRSTNKVNKQHTLLFRIITFVLRIVLLIVVFYGSMIAIALHTGGVW